MSRNLVICLDGTGGQVRANGDTNVVRLFGMLDLSDAEKQIAYYDPGVGTFAAAGAWTGIGRALSRVGGLAFGAGLSHNLGEVYTWLMREWRPTDRVFIFGFSRGAYTARALCGMLRTIGLMRPGSENLVPYAVASYTKVRWKQAHTFADHFARKLDDGRTTIPIEYLGAWDTVKAAGALKWNIKWPYTRELPNVARVRHAVSIDERRRPFREYLVEPTDSSTLEEVWFAGVHSDVGGTFADDHELATIALKWVTDGADGVLLDDKRYAKEFEAGSMDATAQAHRMGWPWAILIPRSRPIPLGAHIHRSIQVRTAALPDYVPKLPADAEFRD